MGRVLPSGKGASRWEGSFPGGMNLLVGKEIPSGKAK